ncbi:glycosyltransferase involved in cell wall biosynthesis [Pedobacter cryoconitis]|uniref:glycosyltransferase family 2 protein n=1 Tax=Pedobacter cryoconitis TaxID=188932 RepID=UPI00161D5136|nr:glycosyltransferase family A protein [Pedobacter cryoconitis]MBB6271536.1 glycosyltransferase involved in cell wall biosynthesis [Pedobacter cryoconitis]
MDNLPLVSVIVPCYNHDKFIETCIKSIVNQTYKNIQIIVIDDGSRDNSPQILDQLSKEYGFFFERQQNQGLSRTLNKGINSYAKGKYISVIASDDYWDTEKIEKQVEFLEQHPNYGIVFGKAIIVDENDQKTGTLGDGISAHDLEFEQLFLDNKVIALTTMIRKEIFDSLGGFNESSYIEDWDLWLKISELHKVGFIDEYMGYYRRHSSNMSSNLLKMEDAKTNIINQWAHHPIYNKGYKQHILQKASILAVKHKKESMALLWRYKQYAFSLTYIKASVKLLFIWK